MNDFMPLMALVGIVTLVISAGYFVGLVFEKVIETIAKKKWEYKYKHRFEKSPTAKCYCIDCISYMDGLCCLHRFRIAGDWFCRNAVPRDREVKRDE